MSSSAAPQQDAPRLLACTVARDVQKFDLLIEDMEAELGDSWGDLSFDDARVFFQQPQAQDMEFVAIAIDDEDEENLADIGDLIRAAKTAGLKVILIAEEVSPIALHQLLRIGAQEFAPYPLPEGALHDAIERIRRPIMPANDSGEPVVRKATSGGDRDGVLLAVHGLAGGVGASTLAVNLAWELAGLGEEPKKGKKDKDRDAEAPQVCILDLDLQFGSISTFLDLERRDAVYELLSDVAGMDDEVFHQSLVSFEDKLHVLTAPSEMLPLDLISSDDVTRLMETARRHFDYVIVDMPTTLVQWSETVLSAAHVYFSLIELDMRSAQNTLRMVRALKSEELPFEKLRFVLNRAPKFTDLSGKSRVRRMAESLDISLDVHLPDGGKQVTQSCDHGMPLEQTAAKNPLRKEIQKLAGSIHEHLTAEDAAQATGR